MAEIFNETIEFLGRRLAEIPQEIATLEAERRDIQAFFVLSRYTHPIGATQPPTLEALRNQRIPKGPRGETRPADVISNAVRVMRIATGEYSDDVPNHGKDPNAKALGSKGGKARAKSMTPERRAEIAKKAAAKRWARPA